MKKVLLSLLMALTIIIMPCVKADVDLPEITDHEKVTVYLFRAETCGHCHDFLEYFAENYYKYQDYFEIVTYEVNKEGNYELMQAAKEYMGNDDVGHVPYILVGNSFEKLGFGTDGTEIIEEALAAYQDENYEDVVQKIIEEEDLYVNPDSLEEACAELNYEVVGLNGEVPKNSLSDGAIVGIIFGVIILGFAVLVIFSRKK